MSKAVLISIRPKWCDLIARGEKTVEVRKTRPKLEPPFKCYIYRTKGTVKHLINDKWVNMPVGGTVIGEFVCDRILDCRDVLREPTCLTLDDWLKYTDGHKGPVYAWHISDLQIYDTLKNLSEFKPWNRECKHGDLGFAIPTCKNCHDCKVEHPPQSWCYVEGLPEGDKADA